MSRRSRLGPRGAIARAAVLAVNAASRAARRGSGTVAGGRVGLRVDPALLHKLSRGADVALVTGTNGKTTTTALVAAALGNVEVATNATGANMPAGHVAAFCEAPRARRGVLEVDESYLPVVLEETGARVVVLLNLSRDQLDRVAEVRRIADRWRDALGTPASTATVVANADDPLVVHAAADAGRVHWVGAGQAWTMDSVGCPRCPGAIERTTGGGWRCGRCGFTRPEVEAAVEGGRVAVQGSLREVPMSLPGRFNLANGLMAAVAATLMLEGREAIDLDEALARVGEVDSVAGRFSTLTGDPGTARLMLAKNPAGFAAMFDLIEEEGRGRPVAVVVNARVADGRDPSWLWDVPFERLAGRPVVVSGDRWADLDVRMKYAGVEHAVERDPARALSAATRGGDADVIANYTAFAEMAGGTR